MQFFSYIRIFQNDLNCWFQYIYFEETSPVPFLVWSLQVFWKPLTSVRHYSDGGPFQALRDPNTDHYKNCKGRYIWHRLCMVYLYLFQYGKRHCFCLFVHYLLRLFFLQRYPKYENENAVDTTMFSFDIGYNT